VNEGQQPGPGDLVCFDTPEVDCVWGRVIEANGRLLVDFGKDRTLAELDPADLVSWRPPGTEREGLIEQIRRTNVTRRIHDQYGI